MAGVNAGTVQFALSPALISDKVLDYGNVADSKLYYRAIAAMDPLFDVEPPGLKLFLENLQNQADTFNWINTFPSVKMDRT